MPKMTKPQLTHHAKLEAQHEAAVQAIYAAAAPRTDVRFNDCFTMASEEAQAAYHASCAGLEAFRQDMIDHGRAYRCQSFGHFTPNWR